MKRVPEEERVSHPPKREDGPVVGLLTIAAVWDAKLGEALHGVGLTTRKYTLLAHIGATPNLSFSELARRSNITVQSAHTAVKALTRDGLVRDATAQAGAASALHVTAEGRTALAAAHDHLVVLDADLRTAHPELTTALRGRHEDAAS